MATEKESSCQNLCANDPNFAIICSFFDRFSSSCGILPPTFSELQEMVENSQDVSPHLIDLHVKLMRKIRRSVTTEKWERALIKFCHAYYCSEDGWELERCGYKKCKVSVKLRILKNLLDAQFDLNVKFKNDINKLTAEELRLEPLGRDKVGQSYWCQFDSAANVRVYKEDQDEETWKLVAKDREGLVGLITQLSSGEELLGLEIINEDSNSQEIEKPIIDTGQVEVSTSEENTADNSSVDIKSENTITPEGLSSTDPSKNNNFEKEKTEAETTSHEPKLSNTEEHNNTVEEPVKQEFQAAKNQANENTVEDNQNSAQSNEQNLRLEESSEVDLSKCNEPRLNQEESSEVGPSKCNEPSLSQEESIEVGPSKCNEPSLRQEESSNVLMSKYSNSSSKNDSIPICHNESNGACSISIEKDNFKTNNLELTSKVDSDNPIENSVPPTKSQHNINVAEEIKQRSLFRSSNLTISKGKPSKSSGSILEQIFSRKLERLSSVDFDDSSKSPINLSNASVNRENLKQESDSQQNTFPDLDSNSCTSNLSDDHRDKDNVSIGKRKPESMFDQSTKKMCMEIEPDDEVGQEIEEPVMIIKGEGSGQECDTGNPKRDNQDDVNTSGKIENLQSRKDISIENTQSNIDNEIITVNSSSINNGAVDSKNENHSALNDKDSNNEENEISSGVRLSEDKSSEGHDKEKLGVNKDLVVNNKNSYLIDEKTDISTSECEKSIEEQLSDLTGECLSPKSCFEPPQEVNGSKNHQDFLCDLQSEKGSRRKSLDSSDFEEGEGLPPEAKKTKLVKDCQEIFGTDESTNYSVDEDKVHNIKDALLKNEEESHVSQNKTLVECDKKDLKNESEANLDLKTQLIDFDSHTNQSDNKCTNKLNTNESIKDFNDLTPGAFEKVEKNVNKEKNILEKNSEPNSSLFNNTDTFQENNIHQITENKNLSDVSKCTENNCKDESKTNEKDNNVNIVKDSSDIISKKSTTDTYTKNNTEALEEGALPNSKEKSVLSNKKLSRSAKTSQINVLVSKEETDKIIDIEVENSPKKTKSQSKNESKIIKNESVENEVIDHSKDSAVSTDVKSGDSDDDLSKNKVNQRKMPRRKKVFTSRAKKTLKNQSVTPKKEETEDNTEKEILKSKKANAKETAQMAMKSNSETDKELEQTPKIKHGKAKQASEVKPLPIASRKRRSSRKNTGTERDSEEDIISDKKVNNEDEEEEVGGKRRKLKGKRSPNKTLRKSVEEKRNCKSSSEDDNHSDSNQEKETKKSPKEQKKSLPSTKKKHSPKIISPKKPTGKSNSTNQVKNKKPDAGATTTPEEKTVGRKKYCPGRNSRAFIGIDFNIDINETSRSVRQSSRLAQIKIKEQADHKLVDQAIEKSGKTSKKKKKEEAEDKQKVTPKKKNKIKKVSEDEIIDEDLTSSEKKKRKRKKKKKNPVKAFNERDPWKSSSGSSSEAEDEEEDHFDEIVEEDEELPVTLKSDHEFSPESDLEGEDEVKPIRRARTAQKDTSQEEGDESKDVDDFACEKCGKKDHPEWILLCDTCDHGWHASCLRPSLMLIPEGDWHCPPCQHAVLVKQLQETLKIYDRDTKRRENEELRKKRLAYVGISLDNVLPSNSHLPREERESGSDSSESSEQSDSESEYSDEPVYQLRQRRQGTTSYRFNEFDDLINSAIQDEVASKPADLVTVTGHTEAGDTLKEEKTVAVENNDQTNGESENKTIATVNEQVKDKKPKKREDDGSYEESSAEDDDEEEEFPRVVPKRNNTLPRPGRKKHRRLNCLDDASDDDDGSDEDFKGSSSEEEEEEEDDEDDSDESGTGRRRSKRGNFGPVRRSSRARKARFDNEFINDDSDESDAPRRKKTKKLWSESGSESDDSTWGRRKKKKSFGSSRGKKFKKNKKFTIEDELSDIEVSKVPKKKRQRKIKYGGLDDLAVEELPARRTRGKKINYQEVLGSESDEDIQKAKSLKRSAIIDDEDEFVADKEEKEESATSSGNEEDTENEEKTSDEEQDEEKSTKEKGPKQPGKETSPKEEKPNPETTIKNNFPAMKSPQPESNDLSPTEALPRSPILNSPKATGFLKVSSVVKSSPPKVLNKVPGRRGRPPKAMIAPPPERLISEDEQYKAVVSKVSTVGHTENNSSDNNTVKNFNINEHTNNPMEFIDFSESPHHLKPIKIPNSSIDQKFINRSPPIKIRSGVPVNALGRKSPILTSPTREMSFFPVKSPTSRPIQSPPDPSSQLPIQNQRMLVPAKTNQLISSNSKSGNPPFSNIKSENIANDDELDDLDDEDLMDDIEEEEEEYDDSDDDILEEGEIPKKVARRMARMEERMARLEERKIAKQMKGLKSVKSGAITIQPVSPAAAPPPVTTASEPKPPSTTQPTQPLLRVVSPLKLMANPPGPLQSTFMHSGLNPRMAMASPPPPRMSLPLRPPQSSNIVSPMGMDDVSAKRRGRGRGKKEKPEQEMLSGGSVIRGMLQQPQSYPPSTYPQQYPPHPRIPFNPQQRMPRPPFHPGHHPLDPSPSGGGTINIKQEPGSHHPSSNPIHIPNKPPTSSAPPYNPSHRFDSGMPPRQSSYPPQGNPPPRPQYGSYPPPPSTSGNYHYGSYPPPITSREEPQVFPVQQQYNEQFPEQTTPASNKGFTEEESGEFGGLVSYFSSQREDDIDT